MKLSSILFVLATAPGGLAFAFRPILARLGLVESRIPPFLTSLEHPYVKDNQYAIEDLLDPKQTFCDPKSDLQAPLPPIPTDLFKELSLDDKSWVQTSNLLSGILDCPLALERLEKLRVEVSMSHSADTEPPKRTLSLFTRLFNEATHLKTLVWMDPYPERDGKTSTSALHSHLMEQNLYLPSINTMVLGPTAEFFVSTAPNLQSLSSAPRFAWTWSGFRHFSSEEDGPQQRLIRSLASAKQLKEVKIDANWSLDLIAKLQDAVPGIKNLTLEGDLSGEGRHYGSAGRSNFKKILSHLAKLESLAELQLPRVSALGVGEYPESGFGCGNAYFGISGVKFGRVETLEYIRETEEAASIIIEAIPKLPRICIGTRCANIQGGKAVAWPWTGRLRDYVLEVWPRLDGKDLVPENQVKEDPKSPVLHSFEEDEKWFHRTDGQFPPAVKDPWMDHYLAYDSLDEL